MRKSYTIYKIRKKTETHKCSLCRKEIVVGDKIMNDSIRLYCIICAEKRLKERIKQLRIWLRNAKSNLKKIDDKDKVVFKLK